MFYSYRMLKNIHIGNLHVKQKELWQATEKLTSLTQHGIYKSRKHKQILTENKQTVYCNLHFFEKSRLLHVILQTKSFVSRKCSNNLKIANLHCSPYLYPGIPAPPNTEPCTCNPHVEMMRLRPRCPVWLIQGCQCVSNSVKYV